MHLLTWVGFGLLGYVPNTLYIWLSHCFKAVALPYLLFIRRSNVNVNFQMLPIWLCVMVLAGLSDAANTDKPRIFCGRVLANAQALYCYGSNNMIEQKRTWNSVFNAIDNLKTSDEKSTNFCKIIFTQRSAAARRTVSRINQN
jgi:hypothetical protein